MGVIESAAFSVYVLGALLFYRASIEPSPRLPRNAREARAMALLDRYGMFIALTWPVFVVAPRVVVWAVGVLEKARARSLW